VTTVKKGTIGAQVHPSPKNDFINYFASPEEKYIQKIAVNTG
jgi:hypothetical protein